VRVFYNMKDFLNESSSFSGISFRGMHDMPVDVFACIYKYYTETGINLLDDYANMVYLDWEYTTDDAYIDIERIRMQEKSLSMLRDSDMFRKEWLDVAQMQIKHFRGKYHIQQARLENEQRIIACTYTARPDVRKKIFELHGNYCLCCGANENITLDHIVSIHKGGQNSIDNLQPLCKSCNSKKGVKCIDYREEVLHGR